MTQPLYSSPTPAISPDCAAPRRLLPMEGAYNVRDLGGYAAADNRQIRWGKIFRSGDMNCLTDGDLERLAAIPLATSIDFRTEEEITAAPNRVPSSLVRVIQLSIDPGALSFRQGPYAGKGEEIMKEINRLLVRDFQDVYTRFFQAVQDSRNAPLLFHCSAGKDRTGYAAALLLAALGVDRQTIVDDYMLSASCVREKYAPRVQENPGLADLFTVKPSYILTALDLIDQEYGGMERYLTENLKVDLTVLRQLYTVAC